MSLKHNVLEHCRQIVSQKLDALRHNLQELSDSAANETKSSAGDKYETSRAMLHIEQDHIRKQISELTAQKSVLDSIDPDAAMKRVALGSIVKTGDTYYFLGTALGRMLIEDRQVIALSLQSPLGSKLKGLEAGSTLMINGKEVVLDEVF